MHIREWPLTHTRLVRPKQGKHRDQTMGHPSDKIFRPWAGQ